MAGVQRCESRGDVFQTDAAAGPGSSAEWLKGLEAYFAWRRTPEGEAFVKP